MGFMMKKILIIISILIFSTSAYANNRLDGFNKWLFEMVILNMLKKVKVKFVRQNLSIVIFGIIINVTKLNIRTI